MIERVYSCELKTGGLVALVPSRLSPAPGICIALGDHTVLCISTQEADEIHGFLKAVVRPTDQPAPDVEIPVGRKGFAICLGNQRADDLNRALGDVLTHLAAAQLAEVANG